MKLRKIYESDETFASKKPINGFNDKIISKLITKICSECQLTLLCQTFN